MKLFDSQSNTEGDINIFHFDIRERAKIIGEYVFGQAYQVIAINCAVVFQPFIYANLYLSEETVILGINRSADNRRELGSNEQLPTDNEVNAVFFWIVFRSPTDTVEVAPLHASDVSRYKSWYESTSIASALSLSALRLISSISCASVILGLASDLRLDVFSEAGVKVRIVLPSGNSCGTSMTSRRLAGISTVCVIAMRQLYHKSPLGAIK